MARAIFVGGTASNVGKSWFTTALCRLLYRRGVRVAPFKAQNMSNNSYPCARGAGEIGRSQVTQARACGLAPEPAMNPVLLKPCGESRSQVIVQGKVWRTLEAREFYEHIPFLRQVALEAYEGLARRFDVVVMEGAGSIAELNLARRDIVNMSMARAAGARVLLVADIERGGIFASILGTLDLLTPEDRALVTCFAVNRFRGDRTLFDDGVEILEKRSQVPCLGVFPHSGDIHLDAEDSLSEPHETQQMPNVAIIRFPRISNTTDFRWLGGAAWLDSPTAQRFDFVILPGTKSTTQDLVWLRATGLDEWIVGQHRNGAQLIGICGGYQMLGEWISDPEGVDGPVGEWPGLGLIAARTTMRSTKTAIARRARAAAGIEFDAYEIHMGKTTLKPGFGEFAILEDGTLEGVQHKGIIGTYLHGALESAAVFAEIFGVALPASVSDEDALDSLSRWLELYSRGPTLSRLID